MCSSCRLPETIRGRIEFWAFAGVGEVVATLAGRRSADDDDFVPAYAEVRLGHATEAVVGDAGKPGPLRVGVLPVQLRETTSWSGLPLVRLRDDVAQAAGIALQGGSHVGQVLLAPVLEVVGLRDIGEALHEVRGLDASARDFAVEGDDLGGEEHEGVIRDQEVAEAVRGGLRAPALGLLSSSESNQSEAVPS